MQLNHLWANKKGRLPSRPRARTACNAFIQNAIIFKLTGWLFLTNFSPRVLVQATLLRGITLILLYFLLISHVLY